MNTYQALIILKNSVAEDAVDGILETVRNEVVKLKGLPKEVARQGKQQFVRPMRKMTSGHYIRVRFELDPVNQAPLLARLKLIDAIFRVQVVVVNELEMADAVPDPASAEKTGAGERSADGQL